MAKTTRAAKPAAHKTPSIGASGATGMPSPLPLSTTEKGITRNASRALVGIAVNIRAACATITTHEALTAFWTQLGSYCGRNQIALASGADSVTVKTPARTARVPQGIRNARSKTAGASA
jgi:hypothetical protein